MKGIDVGSMSLTSVVEIERIVIDLAWMFPEAPADWIEENIDWLDARLLAPGAGKIVIAMQSFVIRAGKRTILVDTCIGNHKERPTLPWMHRLETPYLENLAAAGVRPEEVDVVLCTHLHADHVGWNTRLSGGRWVPTFPNARYVIARAEFDEFMRQHNAKPEVPVARGAFQDSVLPVVEAGQADFVAADHAVERDLDHGIWLEPTPGHTLGHVAVHVKGAKGHALLTGDAIHHPIQFSGLDVRMATDADRAQAAATRRRLAETYAESDTLLVPAHFPDPTAGRVVRRGKHFGFRWLES